MKKYSFIHPTAFKPASLKDADGCGPALSIQLLGPEGHRTKAWVGYILIYIFLFYTALVYGENKDQEESKGGKVSMPPGMEVKKVGDIGILVPQDSPVRIEKNRVVAEDASEYTARKFIEIEKRFAKLETKQEEFKKELEELKKALMEMEKSGK